MGRLFLESEPDPELARRLSPGARLAARGRDRPRATRPPGARGRGPSPQRRDQDRDPARRQPRLALAADRDPRRADGLESSDLELSDEDRARLLATIDTESKRLDRLVANLLDLSRLELGAAEPKPELWTVESSSARRSASSAPSADRVAVTLPANLAAVRGRRRPDRARARQPDRQRADVLAGRPGELTGEQLTARSSSASSTMAPASTKAELERIFEPFEQGRAPSRGTGLGLAIAQRFAEANGGAARG